jgi:hypothetical protein
MQRRICAFLSAGGQTEKTPASYPSFPFYPVYGLLEHRTMRIITGLMFVGTAVVLAVMFKEFVFDPLARSNQQGHYGELYGPVSFLQFVVYPICVIQGIVGLLLLLVFRTGS